VRHPAAVALASLVLARQPAGRVPTLACAGGEIRRFGSGQWSAEPVCMANATARYFYHHDQLGTVAALADATGALAEAYRYTPYGAVETPAALGNPYLFTGRRLDATGLYYYRARMYDPNLGRFLQPDPIGVAGGMNLYRYVGNSPTAGVDPWGLERDVNSFFGPSEPSTPVNSSDSEKPFWQSNGNYLIDSTTSAESTSEVHIGNRFVFAPVLVGAGIGAIYGGVGALMNNSSIGQGIAIGAISGAISGGFVVVLGPSMNVGIGTIIGAGIGLGTSVGSGANLGATVGATIGGAIGGAIGGIPGSLGFTYAGFGLGGSYGASLGSIGNMISNNLDNEPK